MNIPATANELNIGGMDEVIGHANLENTTLLNEFRVRAVPKSNRTNPKNH